MAILDIEPAVAKKAAPQKTAPVSEPNIYGFRTENRSMQTRFHFHMDRCVGCHACEVACAEQNGLPADTLWRRVGEVETGTFPDTQHLFLSSGCNHCLDAPCMKGCPVDAYQVNERGIVLHLDDVCIVCHERHLVRVTKLFLGVSYFVLRKFFVLQRHLRSMG